MMLFRMLRVSVVTCLLSLFLSPLASGQLAPTQRVPRDVPLETIFRGAMPFVGAQIILIFILVAFPEIALWLPSTMAR